MLGRKLIALGFQNAKSIDVSDERHFKNLVVWLEDHKIRHYRIENRSKLKDVQSKLWNQAFDDYLKELQYPYSSEDRMEVVDWLLGYAIRLEYGDDANSYQDISGKTIQEKRAAAGSSAIQNIKDSDPVFKEGVRNLAKALDIPLHEDDKVTLQAVVLLVEERLSEKGLANLKDKSTKNAIPLQQQELGFDTGGRCSAACPVELFLGVVYLGLLHYVKDTVVLHETLNNAARALRLLHINDLRQLQTDINDAIVSVQSLTANPKTDQRLGKVGRG